MRFNKKNIETKSFKKRYSLCFKKKKLIFGTYALTLCKSYNLEYIYIYNFKKDLKKYYKFKKSLKKKVWLFLHKNYPITKKSKNARMGKGKGSVSRYCSRVLYNHNLFEFIGFNPNEIISLKKVFLKKLNIPVVVIGSFFEKTNLSFNKKISFNLKDKKYHT